MAGETADRHPGEHAGPGSPPGWYTDPIRDHSLRRWDGEHWTADIESWPTRSGTGGTTGNTGHSALDKEDVKSFWRVTGLVALVLIMAFSIWVATFVWGFSQEG
jgi:hypothetical protein